VLSIKPSTITRYLFLVVCFAVNAAAVEKPATSDNKISVEDYAGRQVLLKQPATRIIALAPHIVENLFSAGAGNTLVGAVDYCDYPEAAKKVPRVGAISNHSLEAILALKPDLVIGWDSGYGRLSIKKIEKLGIPVYYSNPSKLDDIAKSIRDYGKLTGHKEQADQEAERFQAQLDKLRSTFQNSQQVSVFYQVWNSPLQTLNNDHIISDLIRLCGGVNAFGDLPSLAPKLSIESVLARDPDVIVASGMGEQRPEWLDDWKQWSSLSAVAQHNLYFIPPDIIQRHTARILEGASLMCTHLDHARSQITHPKKSGSPVNANDK